MRPQRYPCGLCYEMVTVGTPHSCPPPPVVPVPLAPRWLNLDEERFANRWIPDAAEDTSLLAWERERRRRDQPPRTA